MARFGMFAAVFLTLLLWIGSARASIVVYSNPTNWAAVAQSPVTVSFNSFTNRTFINEGHSYTSGGVTFADTSANIDGYGPKAGPSRYSTYNAGSLYKNGYLSWSSGTTLTITLPGPYYAIGFDYTGLKSVTETFAIKIGGQTFTETTSKSAPLFFGIYDTVGITSFTIAADNVPTIDNLTFGSLDPPSVPEPGSLLLFATGGLALAILRRRRFATAQAIK